MTAVLSAALATGLPACSGTVETPPAKTQRIDGAEIINELQFNWDRAEERYQGRWFTITVGPLSKVNDKQAIIQYDDVTLKMYFREAADTVSLNREEFITAVCWVDNMAPGRRLILTECRWPTPPEPAGNGKQTHGKEFTPREQVEFAVAAVREEPNPATA